MAKRVALSTDGSIIFAAWNCLMSGVAVLLLQRQATHSRTTPYTSQQDGMCHTKGLVRFALHRKLIRIELRMPVK
jgi:hypothetical protein